MLGRACCGCHPVSPLSRCVQGQLTPAGLPRRGNSLADS
ncbi:hypothetical protein SHJG_0330 [Streptomyces hygroscopicus subsp. jinggangensis 5008]|nr:hypothetical protein SHJG_0330 [Streptomyces hygroscopicus subsp. jinggangensis 5008]AGF59830.1 hypothetical protein SHJGH_0164 [Streptomyces hygroscopicus subsp. jinggangensis TL01]